MRNALRRQARRIAKSIWWAVTPWRMPARLQFMRERAERESSERALQTLLERESLFVAERMRGVIGLSPMLLELASDENVIQAAGMPAAQVICPSVAANAVCGGTLAARFCIDLLRRRADIRSRFPLALSAGADGDFARWLQDGGASELGLSQQGRRALADLFANSYSSRARQVFLADGQIRGVLPHGLTPSGQRGLFEWFMQFGRRRYGLQIEEVWWLFIEAAEDPRRELKLAYLFTPGWQRAHPDGLTVFGRERFAAWVAAAYGASGAWLDSSSWPEWDPPAVQIRTAYWAHAAWQRAHPMALSDAPAAARLLEWLSTSEAASASGAREWCRSVSTPELANSLAAPGVNVIGHFCYASGLRVSAESVVQGLQLVGCNVSLRDVRTDAKDDPFHVRFDGLEYYDVTIIHTQPEPFFAEAYQRSDLFEREPRTYRIAYWYWEFDSIPESWVEHAGQVDEVWAATEFVARGLRKRLSTPVRTLFPGVKLAPFTKRDRTHFGLDAKRYTFLFTFHMMSVMERKNPLGLIRAFKAAFKADEPVNLVLKTSFGDRHPAQIQELREAAAGANITIVDQVYSPDEVLSLMDACDAYVSLHRSEGLGLTMAEAMLMGKPVIATDFSGNVDFMDNDNSLLVSYELVTLDKPIPPYDAGLEWAEPSVEHAAGCMRRVYENQAWARDLGRQAKTSAERRLSLEAAGQRISDRLAEIRALTSGLKVEQPT